MDLSLVVLARAGAGLVLDLDTPWLPRVLHWGADLGPGVDGAALRSVAVPGRRGGAPADPAAPSLLPAQADGWAGGPGGSASRERATVPTRTCGWRRSRSPSRLTAAASR